MSIKTPTKRAKKVRASSAEDPAMAKSPVSKFFGRLALAIVVIITLFPIYWMVRTAFSDNRAMFGEPLSLLPVNFTLGPIERVLGLATPEEAIAEGGSGASINFGLYMLNSIITATLITVFQIAFSAMAAYAFALLKWKGRDAVFNLFLIALMVPVIFTILPNFVLIKELGLLNTIIGIALPAMFMTPFAIFFLRQFFFGVNLSIIEAAVIDGASQWRIFSRIAVPLVWPQIITLALLQFIFYWNDYLWPLLVGTTEESKLITVGLGIFRSQTPAGNPDWAGLMAGALLAAIPIFILILIFGKQIVGSIQSSGVK
ncbi:carbohydrate ABC transporter membrane protein 2 (CUT1 family) [Salinibacterium amurskyense]|uniref:Carbohydrate ABC transporter membrane protein 2 (CUT1 family) n=1 Tax=Salinibacterium amurskyense TaxID=205941 RepID=A0A2M9D553_9MICO|nr:carbohydrate ABC transporter permease [Salinibacterium amurskyense]PJJ80852.1 carbohydrate ABC transporter membrane protein 2 (CUT1 family) [Salinibacterium amurskyense]RLQ82902.1 carbohydrate ABC transporter permease [Salinibacterium amurskyense]GHD82222.1 sugar ABC transporter permease [Salinibacterium amurskyense]